MRDDASVAMGRPATRRSITTHLERQGFVRFVDPQKHSETPEERRREASHGFSDTISQAFSQQEGASRDIVAVPDGSSDSGSRLSDIPTDR